MEYIFVLQTWCIVILDSRRIREFFYRSIDDRQ